MLVNLQKNKAEVDTDLTVYPVCNTSGRELCDGESLGLNMKLVVRCARCDKVEMVLNNKIFYLQRKHKIHKVNQLVRGRIKKGHHKNQILPK